MPTVADDFDIFRLAQEDRFGAIYADPPWRFSGNRDGAGRGGRRHYECHRLSDLAAMNVSATAADNCVLFLWSPACFEDQAHQLIRAWGFKFKTRGFTWIKQQALDNEDPYGMGFWTRRNTEACLLATKGRPTRNSTTVRELVVEPRREHSRKPDSIVERIEELVTGPYLELFARQPRDGWSSFGNQLNAFG